MLALATPIKLRLQNLPELGTWDVRTNTEDADRSVVPAADVRCVGADASAKQGGVMVGPVWQVELVVRRGDEAAEQLDQALSAVICSLQGWQPGKCGGRGWEALTLVRITEPVYADVGLVGYELSFSTSGLYPGQP